MNFSPKMRQFLKEFEFVSGLSDYCVNSNSYRQIRVFFFFCLDVAFNLQLLPCYKRKWSNYLLAWLFHLNLVENTSCICLLVASVTSLMCDFIVLTRTNPKQGHQNLSVIINYWGTRKSDHRGLLVMDDPAYI